MGSKIIQVSVDHYSHNGWSMDHQGLPPVDLFLLSEPEPAVTLLNQFAPADVLVAENQAGSTTFRRIDENALTKWLADYSLGELWEKNVLGGRP